MQKVFLFIVVAFVAIVSCSAPKHTYNANLVGEGQDVIVLRCIGSGTKEVEAVHEAEKSAFYTILFRGVPASQCALPMAQISESEFRKLHSTYYQELFDNGRFRSFILSSVPVGEYRKKTGAVTLDVKVNIKALRLDLEHSNIIRKFGL